MGNHLQNLSNYQACAIIRRSKSPLEIYVGSGPPRQSVSHLAGSNKDVGPTRGGGQQSNLRNEPMLKENTQSEPSYHTWFDHLRILYPISGLLYVGGGVKAQIERYKAWQIPNVLIFDADRNRLPTILKEIETINEWSAHDVLLSDKEGEATYYSASNPTENGPIAPEILTPIWQNLHTLDQQSRSTTTLKAVFEDSELKASADSVNWGIINCLTSLPILQGAGDVFDRWDVVIARTILNKNLIPERLVPNKVALDALMAEHGFRPLANQSERHPAITNVLYLRDHQQAFKIELCQMSRKCDSQRELARQRQTEIDQLKQQNQEIQPLRQQRDEHAIQLQQLEEKFAQLTEERDKLAQQAERLTKENCEQRELAGQRQTEIDQLKQQNQEIQPLRQQRDEHAIQLQQLEEKFAQLTEERDKLAQQAERLTKENCEQRELAGQRQTEIDQLKQQNQEIQPLRQQRDEHAIQLQQLEEKFAQLTEERDKLAQQAERLTKENCEQRELAGQRQTEIDQLKQQNQEIQPLRQQRDEHAIQLQQLEEKFAQLTEERDKLAQQAERLTKENCEQRELAGQRQTEIDQLKQQNQEIQPLRQQRDEHAIQLQQLEEKFAQLTEERDKLAQQAKQQILELRETNYRNCRIDEEMVKFETQLDFIKELLLLRNDPL